VSKTINLYKLKDNNIMTNLSPLAQQVLKAMKQNHRDGHCYSDMQSLIDRMKRFNRVTSVMAIQEAIQESVDSGRLINTTLPDSEQAIYQPAVYQMEKSVAKRLQAISAARVPLSPNKLRASLRRFEGSSSLSDEQLMAVVNSITSKVSVLTGGPGTGKTTTLKATLNLAESMYLKVALCAPTGQAAKRMTQSTGREATTIHRLLRYNPEDKAFGYDRHQRLPLDFIVIDESSMIDLWLLHHLLQAVQDKTRLMFVGDIDQLPSVGAGNVLKDIITSELAQVSQLTTIFRQSDDSHIVTNAQAINRGQMPDLSNQSRDFFMFRIADERISEMVTDIVANRIPQTFGLEPESIQVLAPTYKGRAGVDDINQRLQAHLTDSSWSMRLKHGLFKVGDRVIQTRNNYGDNVMNGEVGQVAFIDRKTRQVTIQFDDQRVTYSYQMMWQVKLAYAMTIHRSQGSEYDAVVMPVHSGQAGMLQRNLLYTAITRAKKMVVLVGDEAAIQQAIACVSADKRRTGLAVRIRNAVYC
jgi:exodeoxyribonuclease V alpha subunit